MSEKMRVSSAATGSARETRRWIGAMFLAPRGLSRDPWLCEGRAMCPGRFLPVLFFLTIAVARADQAADIAQIHLEAIGGRQRLAALTGLRMRVPGPAARGCGCRAW